MPVDITIRPAVAADFALASGWLQAEGLPTEDLTAAHMEAFLLAMRAEQPVGMIGLQQFGQVGLLRSLVVDRASRNDGIGARLVAALDDKARRMELRELWLLTIDADGFFARHARRGAAQRPTDR